MQKRPNKIAWNPMEAFNFTAASEDNNLYSFDMRRRGSARPPEPLSQRSAFKLSERELSEWTQRVNLTSDNLTSDRLDSATIIHKDCTGPVMDVDYSPTGREFVAASYDRSIRIFSFAAGRSREVYHTKRMQRVFAARFSGDGAYVFSGSEDMNVRIWKSDAAAQMGVQARVPCPNRNTVSLDRSTVLLGRVAARGQPLPSPARNALD